MAREKSQEDDCRQDQKFQAILADNQERGYCMEAHAYKNKAGVSSDKAMYELLRNLSQVSGELHRRLGHSFSSNFENSSQGANPWFSSKSLSE
jgi:predicted deacetylase